MASSQPASLVLGAVRRQPVERVAVVGAARPGGEVGVHGVHSRPLTGSPARVSVCHATGDTSSMPGAPVNTVPLNRSSSGTSPSSSAAR